MSFTSNSIDGSILIKHESELFNDTLSVDILKRCKSETSHGICYTFDYKMHFKPLVLHLQWSDLFEHYGECEGVDGRGGCRCGCNDGWRRLWLWRLRRGSGRLLVGRVLAIGGSQLARPTAAKCCVRPIRI